MIVCACAQGSLFGDVFWKVFKGLGGGNPESWLLLRWHTFHQTAHWAPPSTKQLTNPPIPSPKPTNHIWPPPKLLGQFVTKSPQHSTLDKSIFFTTFGRRQIPVLTRIVPSSCFGGTKTFDWQHNVPTGHLRCGMKQEYWLILTLWWKKLCVV